jgi:hypothetical protein
MVAAAVGQRYPGGDTEAGLQFLEKIVQVPLHLPPIQSERLRDYFDTRLKEVISRTGAPNRIPDRDLTRLYAALNESVLSLTPTPRNIYRLANVLLVAIPLLEDEANLTDIILIEALRIFYPDIYEPVKQNETLFTGPSSSPNQFQRKDIYSILGEQAEKAGKSLSLLANLFPVVDSTYYNAAWILEPRRRRTQEELNYTKSIASTYYFERYFYYAIQKGAIPEQTFKLFLEEMSNGQVAEAHRQAVSMIDLSSDEEFFRRLENRVELSRPNLEGQSTFEHLSLDPEESERYCELLILLSSKLTQNVVGDRSLRLVSRSSGLLLSYLISLPQQVALAISKRVITDSAPTELPLELMVDLHNIRRRKDDKPEMNQVRALFTDEPYQELARIFVTRLQTEATAQDKPWYDLFPFRTQHIIIIWKAAYGHYSLVESLNASFNNNLNNVITFLHNVSPIGTSGRIALFLSLSKETYQFIRENADAAYIYSLSSYLVAGKPPITYINDDFVEPDAHERVQQFILLHESYLKEKEKLEQEEIMRQIRSEEEDDSANETVDFEPF